LGGKTRAMVERIILVLGDQLNEQISSLDGADRATDLILMAEVRDEASYVLHHPKKIAFTFSAMRKFAAQLQASGWSVRYVRYDDPANTGSLPGEVSRALSDTGAAQVIVTEPGEWRLIHAFQDSPVPITLKDDTRFLVSHHDFESWAQGRKSLRMEYFYREMRRKTGLLMDQGQPVGGQWNFDADNRKKPPKGVQPPPPLYFPADGVVGEVLELVGSEFAENFGALHPFEFATDREQALKVLDHFIEHALPSYGDYQDAMLIGENFMWHALIAPYLNVGLLLPLEACRAAERAYYQGQAPLNAVEGFIRQIIGWREYIRGIYFLQGPDYVTGNALNHERQLPAMYWGGPTKMRCMSEAIGQTREMAYAHHIQRLMITGNFALLAGVDPHHLHEWYLAVYADAYEWVEAPNTIGMSQFADGGIIASKPYVSSGAYINRMSDYCKSCHYKVSAKTGESACPFNLLYWHFLDRHRNRFGNNPRMANMYRTWARLSEDHRITVLREADALLASLDRSEVV